MILSDAVGRNRRNLRHDVLAVQKLVNANVKSTFPQRRLVENGVCDAATIDAIVEFQRRVVGMARPDGVVSPGGSTLVKLEENGAGPLSPRITGTSLPPVAHQALKEILVAAKLSAASVTSVNRTAADQARIMFEDIRRRGIAKTYRMYGPSGDQIVKVYEDNAGKPNAIVIALMESKIKEVGKEKISNHLNEKYYVFDVDPGSIANHDSFKKAVEAHRLYRNLISPPIDRAFHVELLKTP
jgi:hypothetical protein